MCICKKKKVYYIYIYVFAFIYTGDKLGSELQHCFCRAMSNQYSLSQAFPVTAVYKYGHSLLTRTNPLQPAVSTSVSLKSLLVHSSANI